MSKRRQAYVGIDVGSKELVVKIEKLGCEQEGGCLYFRTAFQGIRSY